MKLAKTKHPYIYQSDLGVFYVRMFRKKVGKRLTKSLGTRKITVAQKRAEVEIQKYLNEKPIQPVRPLVMDVWADFLRLIQKTRDYKTFQAYEIQGRIHLLPYFGEKHVDSLKPGDWEQYVAYATEKTPGRKLDHDRRYLIAMFRFAMDHGIITKVPKFRRIEYATDPVKVLTKDDQWKLLRSTRPKMSDVSNIKIKRDSIKNGRNLRLRIYLALKMGLRKNETNIQWDRVDFDAGVLRLKAEDVKGGKRPRIVPMVRRVHRTLNLKKKTASTAFIFESREFKRAWATAKRRAGVNCRFHDLRDTCATEMVYRDVPPVIAARILGHSLEMYDRRYCRPSEDALKTHMGVVE